MKNNVKINLDKFRFLAALLVISIHTYPFLNINSEIDYIITRVLLRTLVPFFLMTTGYFLIPKALKHKEILNGYVKKIIKIYIICILIYLPINIYTKGLNNLNLISILKGIFIDGTFYHLWYFPALILGILITYIILKKLNNKKSFLIFIILYLIGLFGDSYYGLIKNTIFENVYNYIFMISNYTRNGLFYVPIFLYLGYTFNTHNYNITKKQNIILLILFSILLGLEGYNLYLLNIPRHNSMYLTLIPCMILLFSLLIKTNNTQNKNLREISELIYIIHPMSIIFVRGIAKFIKLENIMINNNFIHYICVVILTLIICIIFIKIKEVIKHGYRKRKNFTI